MMGASLHTLSSPGRPLLIPHDLATLPALWASGKPVYLLGTPDLQASSAPASTHIAFKLHWTVVPILATRLQVPVATLLGPLHKDETQQCPVDVDTLTWMFKTSLVWWVWDQKLLPLFSQLW